jgi:hypothetical protein
MGCPRFIRFQKRVWYCLLPTTQSNSRRQQPVPSQTLTFPATIPIQTKYIHMISHKPIISLSTTFKFYLLTALTRNIIICMSTAKKGYSYIVHRHTYVSSKRKAVIPAITLEYLSYLSTARLLCNHQPADFSSSDHPLLPELIMLK